MDWKTGIEEQVPKMEDHLRFINKGKRKQKALLPWWQSKKWGIIASVSLIPYALLKILWAFEVTIGIPKETLVELHASMVANSGPVIRMLYQYGIDITTILAIIASLLALSLVQSWGRKLPRSLLLIPAWLGGVFFTIIGCLSAPKVILWILGISGAPGNTGGIEPWVFLLVYGGFLVWGITICLAALSFHSRTRRW